MKTITIDSETLISKFPWFEENFNRICENLTDFDAYVFNLIYSNDIPGKTIERGLQDLFLQHGLQTTFTNHVVVGLVGLGLLDYRQDAAGYLRMDHSYMPIPLFLEKSVLGHLIHKKMSLNGYDPKTLVFQHANLR